MLQYFKLFEVCFFYFQGQLIFSNCLGMIRFSEILSCEIFKKKVREVVLIYFLEVVVSVDLKEFCVLELRDYFGDDGLCGEEEKVFEVFMVWIKYDFQVRKRYMQELFKQVRFQYIYSVFFYYFIVNDVFFQFLFLCQIILEIVKRQMFFLYSIISVLDF